MIELQTDFYESELDKNRLQPQEQRFTHDPFDRKGVKLGSFYVKIYSDSGISNYQSVEFKNLAFGRRGMRNVTNLQNNKL